MEGNEPAVATGGEVLSAIGENRARRAKEIDESVERGWNGSNEYSSVRATYYREGQAPPPRLSDDPREPESGEDRSVSRYRLPPIT